MNTKILLQFRQRLTYILPLNSNDKGAIISNRIVVEEVENDYLRDNIHKFFYEFESNEGELPPEKLEDKKTHILGFVSMWVEELQFIQDGHFAFMYGTIPWKTTKKSKIVMTEEYQFLLDEQGFYTTNEDENFYLISVEGEDPKNYLELSINERGMTLMDLKLKGTGKESENQS
ncbi:MAG: hypothetical protein ACLKAK_06975 [Alkaliphilus sp.]